MRVARDFINRVKERAGRRGRQEPEPRASRSSRSSTRSWSTTLGGTTGKLTIASKPPTVVMMAGLQGSGKTTAAAKLARLLKQQGRRPLLVGADLQRPAAVQQLRVLGERVEVPVFSSDTDPVSVARGAMEEAARLGRDVVIVDTAGRLQIDADLMDELRHMRDAVQPHDTLLVVDAMTGQEAVNVATEFDEAVGLTGVILTKIDGDARRCRALGEGSRRQADPLRRYRREARRVRAVPPRSDGESHPRHGRRAHAHREGRGHLRRDGDGQDRGEAAQGQLTLEDFLDQMRQVKKMGPIQNILGMLPGMPKELKNAEIDDREIDKIEAIICSMTLEERRDPSKINGARRLRIARGSGTTTSDVNGLLKQFKMVQQMMRSAGKGKMPKLPVGEFPA